MSNLITIDGGTTNTRISLVINGGIARTLKLSIGARAGIETRDAMIDEIKRGIETVISDSHIAEKDVECIIASGMITSEFGLFPLEHVIIPAGIEDLRKTYDRVNLNAITSIPFVFIRGIKKLGTTVADTDMIRGEETELMGIIDASYGECIYVLPGSHSKVINVNNEGVVTDFSTLMTGEMIASLSQNTILKDAVDLSVREIQEKFLLYGYEYCLEYGINNTLFKVRILKNIFKETKENIYSFFVGAIICAEIREILRYDAKTVVIGGKAQLKEALASILKAKSDKEIVVLSEDEVDSSVVRGMIRIYNEK